MVVSRSGTQPAYDVQVALGKHGAIHLAWLQSTKGDSGTLRHSVSYDDAASWSVPDSNEALAPRNELRTVMDSCGVLHAVFENRTEGGNRSYLEYTTWADGWQTPSRLFRGWYSMSAELALSARSEPIIVFMKSTGAPGTESPLETVYSEYRRRH